MCRRLIYLISFAVLLIAASSVQALTTVTTAMGNGADTYVSNNIAGKQTSTQNWGTEVRARVRTLTNTRFMAGYIRFDISEVAGDMTGATLSMTTTYLKSGAKTWNVYGLTDETLDLWGETTITYANAPGMLTPPGGNNLGNYDFDATKLTLLGTITSPAAPGNVTGTYYIVFSSDPTLLSLGSFLNADTNKLVTLVLIAQGDCEHEFATKENTVTPALMRPTLTFSNALRSRATYPNPADKATDVPRDVVLSWTPMASAATHKVYVLRPKQSEGNRQKRLCC